MKNLITTFCIVFLSLNSIGQQVAIIKDADGFTNVRKEPNPESEVITKLYENEVFWFYSEGNEDWIEVYIPVNKYSLGCPSGLKLSGYIHRSRLLPLDELPIYDGLDFSFTQTIIPFDTLNKIIETVDGKYVYSIDGRTFWGTDGGLPRNQIQSLDVKYKDEIISISKAFFEDIYEISTDYSIYKNGTIVFVYQMNSDGAGGYELVWVFNEKELKQRLVGSIL